MGFKDVIDDYSDGASGTITTANGGSIGYTVSGNAPTVTHSHHGSGSAKIYGNGSNEVQVTFDQPVVGASVTLFGSNANERYLIEVDGEIVDLNTLIASGDASFENIGSTATHKINPDGSISGGHHTDGSVGQVVFHFPVESVGATGAGTGGWDGVEIGIDQSSFSAVCFAGETGLRAKDGYRPAQEVQVGDLLWTHYAGLQPVQWVGRRHYTATQILHAPHLRSISIAPGALGPGRPRRRLQLSRHHRLLVSSKIAARVCGHTDVMVSAFRLLTCPGVTVQADLLPLTYVHILMDQHHILDADGAPAESLLVGPMALQTLASHTRADQSAFVAQVLDSSKDHRPARKIPTPAQQRRIAERHARNTQPVLQCYVPGSYPERCTEEDRTRTFETPL